KENRVNPIALRDIRDTRLPSSSSPASQLSGLSPSGSLSSAMMALHADCKLQIGDHSFFKISKQISPVCLHDTHHKTRLVPPVATLLQQQLHPQEAPAHSPRNVH